VGLASLATAASKVEHLVFSEADEAKAQAKLVELLDAKVIVRGLERTVTGSPIYVERPDSAIQLAAAVKIIEYRRGKPKQMVEIDDPGARAGGNSPAGMRDLPGLVAKHPQVVAAILAATKNVLNLAQAIDVTPTSASSTQPPAESKSGGSPS
jgi:hypothetical protein